MAQFDNPCEVAAARVLRLRGIRYTRPDQGEGPHPPNMGRLDFYLPDFDVYIEVKTYSSPRLHHQIVSSGAESKGVIVLIGMGAIDALAGMLDAVQRR